MTAARPCASRRSAERRGHLAHDATRCAPRESANSRERMLVEGSVPLTNSHRHVQRAVFGMNERSIDAWSWGWFNTAAAVGLAGWKGGGDVRRISTAATAAAP